MTIVQAVRYYIAGLRQRYRAAFCQRYGHRQVGSRYTAYDFFDGVLGEYANCSRCGKQYQVGS